MIEVPVLMAPVGYVRVQAIAARLSVHPGTVRRWIQTGRLGGTLFYGAYLITEEEYEFFCERYVSGRKPWSVVENWCTEMASVLDRLLPFPERVLAEIFPDGLEI